MHISPGVVLAMADFPAPAGPNKVIYSQLSNLQRNPEDHQEGASLTFGRPVCLIQVIECSSLNRDIGSLKHNVDSLGLDTTRFLSTRLGIALDTFQRQG